MPAEEFFEVNELTAGYDPDVDIITDVTLTVNQGQIVSLVGPNGCGKSTVLRCLAGKLRPRQGTIKLQGHQFNDHRPDIFRRHGLTYSPQANACFRSLTVEENLEAAAYQLMKYGDHSAWIAETWNRFPRLKKLRSARAGDLSGGERRLLSVSMSLLPQSEVVILDEPSASLSTSWIEDLEDVLYSLLEESGALIMAEQNVGFVAGFSDHVLIMRQGRIDQRMTGEEFGKFLHSRGEQPLEEEKESKPVEDG